MRLTRTFDLTGVTAAQAPELQFDLRYDVEAGYDHVIVEARTAGGSDWTTLPDLNGGTVTDAPEECDAGGFLFDLHPFLATYLGEDCAATGSWNAFTGANGDYEEVAFDLSAYAGKQVEISISYVTDPSTGGTGAAVDDTRLVAGGADAVRRRVRGRDERLGRRARSRPAARSRRQLGDRRAADRPDRGHRDGGHAAARLRPRAAGHRRRSRGAARAGARRPRSA